MNDFIAAIGLQTEGASAYTWPLEFYIPGLIKDVEPWSPVDSLANMALVSFSLTWDWAQDFQREVHKVMHPELADLAEELTPYSKNYLHNVVTILDEEDVRQMGKWSETPLSDRFFENLEHLKSAEPQRKGSFRSSDAFADNSFKETASIDEQMASNNWVISGKHTATGMPMLASDPHLGTSIPSFWTLMELVWEDKFLIGGSLPGVPLIGIGRSKNVSWG